MSLNLIIDIGNSRIKTGIFQAGELQTVLNHSHAEFPQALPTWLKSQNVASDIQYIGCANVGNKDILTWVGQLAESIPGAQWLAIDANTPLPVVNDYRTPKTLGMDRICACIGARNRAPEGALLVIDAGTAITYDYLDARNHYQGGGIAPGLRLRFRSLNDYTAALPLVDPEADAPLVGYNTETSIRSGVLNGLLAEITGIVGQYQARSDDQLHVFLTGGDAVFLGNRLKNIIFADSDLLLYGIETVVTYYFSNA